MGVHQLPERQNGRKNDMKKLLSLFFVIGILSFNVMAQNYPLTLDDDDSLGSYRPWLSTYITESMDATQTTVNVNTAEFWTETMEIQIGNERMLASKNDNDTLNVVRGINGTVAVSHSMLSTVQVIWGGYFWNF